MDQDKAREMIDDVSGLLRQRLGARGPTLAAQVDSRARRLPRKVRRAAGQLAEAETLLASPALSRRIDMAALARAHRVCAHHLRPLGRAGRRWDFLRNLAATIALGLITLAVVFLILKARGAV